MTALLYPWKKHPYCRRGDCISKVGRIKQNDQIKRAITTLFVDIGAVLLTDGWSHGFRKLAAKTFDLNQEDMERGHNQACGTYDLGSSPLRNA
jgi:hypothetical protein